MKTAIIYYSKHHENTKRLLDEIRKAADDDITLIDAVQTAEADLTQYDMIGFASGIYYSKFEKRVLAFARNHLPKGKKVFFIYTYGAEKQGYTKAIRDAIADKDACILGEYGCLGFNTFGPFKLIGGIAKNHPDGQDISKAIQFYRGLGK